MNFTMHVRSLLILLFAILWSANGVAARGSDPTELFAAADKGDAVSIKKALAAGIDVNTADPDGWTALMVAASAGKLPAVQALVKAGANVNAATGKGETALMAAALSGNAAIVKLLLAEGADKTVSSAQGLTAADVAARAKHPELSKLLQPAQTSKASATQPSETSAKKMEAKVDAAAAAFQAGSYADAAKLFREVVTLDPRHALAWHFLGQSLAKNGDNDGARTAYEKAIEVQPTGQLAERTVQFLAKLPKQTIKDCADCPEMVVIPPGVFQMGSTGGEAGRENNEGPLHEVRIKKFALGKYEVTVGEFRRFISASGYQTDAERNVGKEGCFAWDASDGKFDWRAGRSWSNPGWVQNEREPVVCVSHNDALVYVKWLSEKTGKTYRLPSESEWEYAARAGTTTSRYWGDDPSQACRYANVADQTKSPQGHQWNQGQRHECSDGYWYTAPVGSYVPNEFGLYDMIGNAWEWVEDCWHDNYNGAPEDGSAWTSGQCESRGVRGGSWLNKPQLARSARRGRITPGNRINFYGFRPARMLP